MPIHYCQGGIGRSRSEDSDESEAGAIARFKEKGLLGDPYIALGNHDIFLRQKSVDRDLLFVCNVCDW